jgi:hypothetical protein
LTITLTAALILTLAGFLVLLDRKDARAKLERDADRTERQVLLQRIQAPEAATYEHAAQHLPQDPSGLPMSDEQLAEAEERQRMLDMIERAERGVA